MRSICVLTCQSFGWCLEQFKVPLHELVAVPLPCFTFAENVIYLILQCSLTAERRFPASLAPVVDMAIT